MDMVAVVDVATSIAKWSDRYLTRVYTEHELECCEGAPDVRAAGLAARFAAKEAVVKLLRPTGARPDWRSIEVCRAPEGACDIRLSGQARNLAVAAGIDDLAVSLTHEGLWAAAVVVATCTNPLANATRRGNGEIGSCRQIPQAGAESGG
ncbi:MAG: holo-ACP synthase [Acidimicrobiales bacterium]